MTTKAIRQIQPAPPMHWVGDGFPVTSVISPQTVGKSVSPYILMDYAGPAGFGPSEKPRGVDTHPHRGFETVTVVYQGELEHRDSAGNSGSISAGDVQWMTAASGVLHEEKHSAQFTREGGVLEMAQLWVNLPASHKMTPPRYQELLRDRIPTVELAEGKGSLRVIAGDFGPTPSAAQTVTPVILWDGRLEASSEAILPVPEGFSVAVFVRSGTLKAATTHTVESRQLAVFEQTGADIHLEAETDVEFLVVGGEPIDEPVVAYGPFVMNKPEEIEAAIADVRAGRFGVLA
ncbi:MAG: pirin family protein [Thermoanaerobaculia bacterium]|nr:pirin family protein [Thermoanaerobaculia bacterium]